MRPVGFWCEHPLQALTHSAPNTVVTHSCPKCSRKTPETRAIAFRMTGPVREVLHAYQDHVINAHSEELEDCGCCGASHFPEFDGDCREDWERF